jgi:hypothetical protein
LFFNKQLKRFLHKLCQDGTPRSPILENARKAAVQLMVYDIDHTLKKMDIVLMYPKSVKVYLENMKKRIVTTQRNVRELWQSDGQREFFKTYFCGKMPKDERQELVQTLLWECQKNIEPYTIVGCLSHLICPELCPRVLNFLGHDSIVHTTSTNTSDEIRLQSGIEQILDLVLDSSFLVEMDRKQQDSDDQNFPFTIWYVPIVSASFLPPGGEKDNVVLSRSGSESSILTEAGTGENFPPTCKQEIEEFLSTLKKLIYVTFLSQFLRRYKVKKKETDWKSVFLFLLVGCLLVVAPFLFGASSFA